MQEQGGNGAAHGASAACLEFDAQLSDYLEGGDLPAVPAHAAECGFCGALLADLLLARSDAAELADDGPPARVWANVRAALETEGLIRPPRRRWTEWLLRPVPAAGLTAIVLLSVFATRSWLHRNHQAATTAVAIVDPGLVESVSQMEVAYRARSAGLNPTVKQAYEEDLKSLNGEIKECNASLALEPDDGFSREYLASAYTEKARVLESALELGDSDGR
jgi:hypothetical protein